MTRLTSIEKGGFYAFPDQHLPAVASLFAPARRGGKLLDPCAGEGAALEHLAQAWQLTPYANELDDQRAVVCKTRFGAAQTVQGDLYQLKASHYSFTAAWVNPPYAWDSTGDEKRREFSMLKHALRWVQPGGYLFWIVYSHHLTLETATWLTKHSQRLDIWRLPGLHLNEYSQILAVAQVGQPAEEPGHLATTLFQARQANALPELTVQATPCYEFPVSISRKQFVFLPKVIPAQTALAAVQEAGVQYQTGMTTLLQPAPPPELVKPIVRPRGGQLALILAAGLFNGLVLEDGTGGRMAVRSTVESVEQLVHSSHAADEGSDNETSIEREVYRTQSQVTITLLGEAGSVQDLSGDAALAAFIQQHKPALLHYLDEHFQPLYTFDYSPYRAVLSRVKGGKLFQTQRHVIAACCTALQQRKQAILVGEMGVGKSICGASVAAALQPQMQPGQVVLVLCPPHLVEKWEREIRDTGARVYTRILKQVADVTAFMAHAERDTALHVGIVSREAAKLGEGWSVAVQWRRTRLARWRHDEPCPEGMTGERLVTLDIPLCPSCSTPVTEDGQLSHTQRRGKRQVHGSRPTNKASAVPVTKAWLERLPRFCGHCGAALWTEARTFSQGKRVNGQPKTPRVPLAHFIAKRYPRRVFLLLSDELHEAKSTSTDQGEALMILAHMAQKVLGLTGTVYGGAASSLYGIEFTFNPRVRQRYPWHGGLTRWVKEMGSLERVVEYRPEHDKAGVYSGKRRIEQKPREAPGCSPLLVAEIVDHALFVGLSDIGKSMPAFEEIPVPIAPTPEMETRYAQAKQTLGQYLFQCRLEGDASALGMYLQTLLSWPSAPYRTEHCIHRKRLGKDSEAFLEIPVHTISGLPEETLYPKEQWLLDIVRQELEQGRGVAVFVRQTGQRNIQPRLDKLLREHMPGARPYILKSTVQADQREHILNKQVDMGCNVLICNPELVKTGLDLLAFPTIVFLEVSYSLYTMAQASRRAWRLIQTQDCRVYYPYYTGMMEHQAVELIGRKQQAAALLYGENTNSGLSTLHGSEGGNLLAVLAAELSADTSVTDLRDLFARAARETDPMDSAWYATDIQEVLEVVATPEAQPGAESTPSPLLMPDMRPVFMADHATLKQPTPPVIHPMQESAAALPPVKKPKRRRVHLLEVPPDAPVSTLDLLAGLTEPTKAQPLPVPVVQPLANPVQLALF